MEKKFNTVLTVILVVAVIAIIILVGFWAYDFYTKYKLEQDALKAIAEFENAIGELNNSNMSNDILSNTANSIVSEPQEEPQTNTNTSSGGSSGQKYKNFTILGQIEIPKTKVNYPVLAEVSPKALSVSVAQLYGPGLNKPGNTIIIGHNNRNGLFFSNNKKLAIGDKIYITDLSGNKLEYTIYNKYETTDTDTEYMTRETNGATEISLSTCTDDNARRIIIWAKAN